MQRALSRWEVCERGDQVHKNRTQHMSHAMSYDHSAVKEKFSLHKFFLPFTAKI